MEERVVQLEREVAELKGQVSAQPILTQNQERQLPILILNSLGGEKLTVRQVKRALALTQELLDDVLLNP